MGELRHIRTKMVWPLGVVFRVPDEFNGHTRGEHYFRDADGDINGPYQNYDEAAHHLGLANAAVNRV